MRVHRLRRCRPPARRHTRPPRSLYSVDDARSVDSTSNACSPSSRYRWPGAGTRRSSPDMPRPDPGCRSRLPTGVGRPLPRALWDRSARPQGAPIARTTGRAVRCRWTRQEQSDSPTRCRGWRWASARMPRSSGPGLQRPRRRRGSRSPRRHRHRRCRTGPRPRRRGRIPRPTTAATDRCSAMVASVDWVAEVVSSPSRPRCPSREAPRRRPQVRASLHPRRPPLPSSCGAREVPPGHCPDSELGAEPRRNTRKWRPELRRVTGRPRPVHRPNCRLRPPAIWDGHRFRQPSAGTFLDVGTHSTTR